MCCQWLGIKSNDALIYPRSSGWRTQPQLIEWVWGSEPTPNFFLTSGGQKQKTSFPFSEYGYFRDHLPSLGFYFFVPFPFALFPITSMGGHSVPTQSLLIQPSAVRFKTNIIRKSTARQCEGCKLKPQSQGKQSESSTYLSAWKQKKKKEEKAHI